MVVVDTSVWADYFRRPSSQVADELSGLLRARRASLVGVVLSELHKGARNDEQIVSLREGLFAVPYIEMNRGAWERAGRIAAGLDASGVRIPMSDVFIAALALEGDHEVYTLDKHFQRIPGLRLYQAEGDSP